MIPSLMVGSAVAGMISMARRLPNCTCRTAASSSCRSPMRSPISVGYLVALVAGTVVTAVLLRIVKPSLQAA